MAQHYIFFAGPDRMGPRAITVLVGLHAASREVSVQDLGSVMGCDSLKGARRTGATSSIRAALRALEERGFVTSEYDKRTTIKTDNTKMTREVLVWKLTPDGKTEAKALAAAVAALSKTRTGLGLIRGTVY